MQAEQPPVTRTEPSERLVSPDDTRSGRIYLAVQTRLHRDSHGSVRTDFNHARYEAWEPFLDSAAELVLLARVSHEVHDTGALVEGPGVNVIAIPFYRGVPDFLRKYSRIRRFFAQTLSEPDALYGARVPDALGLILQRHARSLGAKFFAQVVGDPDMVLRSGSFGWIGRLSAGLVRRLVARTVHQSDGVIYVTREVLQKKYPAGSGRPTLSRSNVELDQKSFAPAPRDYDDQPIRRPIRLITAGSQDQTYKGHDTLIDAVALLRDRGVSATACIIGGGKHHAELVELASRRGVASEIDLAGHLPGAELVHAMILQSDIFVLPSRTEGLSRVLIEAMASGIACLGSNVGGTPELLPAECLFSADSASELADAVQRMAQSPSAMTEAGRAGWETAHTIATSYSGTTILTEFFSRLKRSGSHG